MPPYEWCTVATGTTNDTPDSCIKVAINTAPICPNMTNAEFRNLMMQLRDIALRLISNRIVALSTMWTSEQKRMQQWLGRSDDEAKRVMQTGLSKLTTAMEELKPENFVRYDDELQRTLSCNPLPDSGNNDASVCKPDSAKRVIAIFSHFCTLPDAELRRECKLKVLIHECTHFIDTFDSLDTMYGNGRGLEIWTRANEGKAFSNADSIAHYIAHFEGVDLSAEINR